MTSSPSLSVSSPESLTSGTRKGRRRQGGFTLIEIIVVLGILAILTTLLINNVMKSLDSSRIAAAKLFVGETMKTPLTTYKIQVGDFPSTQDGLQALITAPADAGDRWQGPYIDVTGGKMPLDPWDHPYQYTYPGTHNKGGYDLWSAGPNANGGDGTSAGTGTDNAIGNW